MQIFDGYVINDKDEIYTYFCPKCSIKYNVCQICLHMYDYTKPSLPIKHKRQVIKK